MNAAEFAAWRTHCEAAVCKSTDFSGLGQVFVVGKAHPSHGIANAPGGRHAAIGAA